MSRKSAREYAYKLVFEYIFDRDAQTPTKDQIFQDPNLTKIDADYINNVYEGIQAHFDEIIETISRNAKNFKIDRIFKPDLAALMLAIYEMQYIDDIPLNVSISEAVELVKEYSTDKSYQFVNGVLAGVYKELNK
jgi:N utilization substance protein B